MSTQSNLRISYPPIPFLSSTFPPIVDDLRTKTSNDQEKTIHECLPFLRTRYANVKYNSHGLPRLLRDEHVRFLKKQLEPLPAPFLVLDASRPWIFYWCLNALAILGQDVSSYRESMIATARFLQNPAGGFGGGHGHASHLATTYATVLALAIVGGEEAYDVLDRRSMWQWLSSLKQPNGGFQMTLGGEVDVRRKHAPWANESTTLFDKIPEYIQQCQTYEGGISGHPNAEAHGAYAFCALGCLSILDVPYRSIPRYLNVDRLIAWLSARQYAPEGGFAGRTNKLVDGCYNHWVGGCWPLVEGVISPPLSPDDIPSEEDPEWESCSEAEEEAQNVTSTAKSTPTQKLKKPKYQKAGPHSCLYHREALIRYTLCCCQDNSKRGGLRDKPSKASDAYHTNYVLAGLASAQHLWRCQEYAYGYQESAPLPDWFVARYDPETPLFDDEDYLQALHPVYVIPQPSVTRIRGYFVAKPGI